MPHSDKPISAKQRAANRANAAKSTGPRTPEGKARSARNACKHGFTASTFSVVRLEEIDEVVNLKADLVAVYQPVNSQELFALERMAIAQQMMLRGARLEVGLFTTCLNIALTTDDQPLLLLHDDLIADREVTRQQNRNYILGEGFQHMARKANTFTLLLRYQAQSERMYRRALEEFDRLKALPPELNRDPDSAEDQPDGDLPNEPICEPQPEANETFSAAPETNPFPPQDPPPVAEPPAGETLTVPVDLDHRLEPLRSQSDPPLSASRIAGAARLGVPSAFRGRPAVR